MPKNEKPEKKATKPTKPVASTEESKKQVTETKAPALKEEVKNQKGRPTSSANKSTATKLVTKKEAVDLSLLAPPPTEIDIDNISTPLKENKESELQSLISEEEEIVASIIAPAITEQPEALAPIAAVDKVTPVPTPVKAVDNAHAKKQPVISSGQKESVTFLGDENPEKVKWAEQLRKHMVVVVNYLEKYKKDFNCYKETVDKFIRDNTQGVNATHGISYSYDAGAGLLTGSYFGQVEIKMPFSVSAHPNS